MHLPESDVERRFDKMINVLGGVFKKSSSAAVSGKCQSCVLQQRAAAVRRLGGTLPGAAIACAFSHPPAPNHPG